VQCDVYIVRKVMHPPLSATRRDLLIVAGLGLHILSVLFPRVVHLLAILYLWCLIEPVQFG